mgnify:CR=1 FL=1
MHTEPFNSQKLNLQQLNTLNKKVSLQINQIGQLISSNEEECDWIVWEMFKDCIKGNLCYEHSGFSQIDHSRLYDIDENISPHLLTSYRYFLEFKMGNELLVTKTSLFKWLKFSQLWPNLKHTQFIQTWLKDIINKDISNNDKSIDDLCFQHKSKNEDELNNSIKLVGDYWSITFNQKNVLIKNSKGMRYINYLIQNQSKEVHVQVLERMVNPPDMDFLSSELSSMTNQQLEQQGLGISNLSNTFELIDEKGKTNLKLHLEQLNDQISEATEFGEIEKVEMLEQEKEQIISQLSASLGLAGKPRKENSPTEQTRKNITNCINKDKKKLKQSFPELSIHLNALKTGTFCIYEPCETTLWK